VFASLCTHAFAETLAEFDDAAARLQYAFLTEDSRALEEVLAVLEDYDAEGGLDALQSYHLAYGYWKLAQLNADVPGSERRGKSGGQAAKAAQSCAEHARAARGHDSRMAEAYAIEAACRGMPQGFLRLAGLGGSCSRSKALDTALTLEPQNPRVLLVEALCLGRAQGNNDALARWRSVVEAFAAAPPAGPGAPDWGYAEALTLLGEGYLQGGEPVAARDAIERALVIAPDYKTAVRLLQAAASAR
jgi:tetratricopeptide (TPR) repeat protein